MILDGVYNDIKDADGFRAECAQGRAFGFDGKTLIHPSQVDPCNEVFAPSEAEVASAREIIAAFDEATAEGRGVVTVNGRMIENLHVDDARRVLAQSEAIDALGRATPGRVTPGRVAGRRIAVGPGWCVRRFRRDRCTRARGVHR